MGKPSYRQKYLFSVLFLMGANLLLGGSYRAKQDSWISLLIAVVALVLWGLVLFRISKIRPNCDVFDLLHVFPTWIARSISFILTVYCFSQGVITLRTYGGFAKIVSLQNTDLIFLLIMLCLSVYFFLKHDDAVLYRFAYVSMLPIILIVFLLFFLLLPMFRSESLYPIAYDNTENIIIGAAECLAFPFGNAIFLLGLFGEEKDGAVSAATWVSICGFAGVLSLIIMLQNILLLGGKLASDLNFPYNFSTSLVNLGDFFSRLEVFASLFFFLSAIVRSAFFIKKAAKGLKTTFSVKEKSLALPLTAFLCGYGLVVFDNTNSVFNYLQIFPYFALPLQFALPCILWIVLEWKAVHKTPQRSLKSLQK